MHDILTFSEGAVREAILNAVSHRDYRRAGSVFVRQYPRRIEVVSPGGFPAGITVENILYRQLPRNRRIAETLERCGLVERSGQGANRMFEESIRQAKPLPDFAGTDQYQVALTLHGRFRTRLSCGSWRRSGRTACAVSPPRTSWYWTMSGMGRPCRSTCDPTSMPSSKKG